MHRRTTTWACASTKSVRIFVLHAEDLAGAIESWEHALRISPDSPDAHTNIASAYIMSKPPQADKAIHHLTYVLQFLRQYGCVAKSGRRRDPLQSGYGARSMYVVFTYAGEQLEPAIQAYKKAKDSGIAVCTT